jgi:predicted DNA-binding transcriptional regulator YafY
MRADRLVAITLLLQVRGKMTAQELSEELEVSRRTILRDVEALSMAGIPLYTEGGHGGGIALDEHYRVTLTGLTEAEASTLFVSGLPNLLQDLGFQERTQHTLLKLFAALPALHREAVERFRQRIYIDPVGWWSEVAPPFWETLQQAVYEDRPLEITYTHHDGETVQRLVEPYSLVMKAGVWYLVARREGEFRTYRVSRLQKAERLPTTFERLEDFDLATFWREHIEQLTSQWLPYAFTVRANERGITFLKQRILELVAHPDGAGWYRAQINVATVEEARMLIFGLGVDGRVLEPPELQEDVLRIARQILNQCGRSFG